MTRHPRPPRNAKADAALLAGTLAAAREAGRKLLTIRRRGLAVARKDGLDIVTAGDLAAERIILARLRQLAPDAAVLSEEAGAVGTAANGECWVVDPLDGTVNFATGLPTYAVSIALKRGTTPALGVVHLPALGEEYGWATGRNFPARGRPFHATGARRLADAVVSVTVTSHYTPELFSRTIAVIDRLARVTRGVRIVVCGAYELALVATGRLDAHLGLKADVFSVAAALPMVRLAGGRATRLDGSPARDTDPDIVASNGRIHAELLDLVNGVLARAKR